MIREAVVGLRVSTDHQDALADDRAADAWCTEHGYERIATYGHPDQGESGGTSIDKRTMGKAIQHVVRRQKELGKSGKCILLVRNMERVSRITRDQHNIAHDILQAGADIAFLAHPHTLREQMADDNEETTFGLNALVAQIWRKKVSADTKRRLADTKAQGFRTGKVPFGKMEDTTRPCVFVRKDGTKKTRYPLIEVPQEQATIQQMIAWADAGWSNARIARALNAGPVPPHKGKWSSTTVCSVLQGAEYASPNGRPKPPRSARPPRCVAQLPADQRAQVGTIRALGAQGLSPAQIAATLLPTIWHARTIAAILRAVPATATRRSS